MIRKRDVLKKVNDFRRLAAVRAQAHSPDVEQYPYVNVACLGRVSIPPCESQDGDTHEGGCDHVRPANAEAVASVQDDISGETTSRSWRPPRKLEPYEMRCVRTAITWLPLCSGVSSSTHSLAI